MINTIVLEGPDNAGKSVLARYIAEEICFPLIMSEGPDKYPGEINDRVRRYNRLQQAVFDRHPCISKTIYSRFCGNLNTTPIESNLLLRFYDTSPLFIYCRGKDLDGHVIKEHDTREHVEKVIENHQQICHAYDEWALQYATVWYRIGDPMKRIVDLVRGAIV